MLSRRTCIAQGIAQGIARPPRFKRDRDLVDNVAEQTAVVFLTRVCICVSLMHT